MQKKSLWFGICVIVLVSLCVFSSGCLETEKKEYVPSGNTTGGGTTGGESTTTTDSDGDGVPDYYEEQYGWNKNNPDTDGDGVNDGDDIDPLVNVIVTIKFTYFKANSGASWSYDDVFTECDSYFVVEVLGGKVAGGSMTMTTVDTWTSSIVENQNEVTTVRTWEYNIDDDLINPSFIIHAYDSDTIPPDDTLDIGSDTQCWLLEHSGAPINYKVNFATPFTITTSGSDATITYEVTANNVS